MADSKPFLSGDFKGCVLKPGRQPLVERLLDPIVTLFQD
jgi:hypothetical protein